MDEKETTALDERCPVIVTLPNVAFRELTRTVSNLQPFFIFPRIYMFSTSASIPLRRNPNYTSGMISASFVPRAQRMDLDLRPESFGELKCSEMLLDDPGALRERMSADGYLFVRGFFRREDVLAARRTVVERMAGSGLLEPGTDPMDAVALKGAMFKFLPELCKDNPALDDILYRGALLDFYRNLFGEEVRHFDYTWFRTVAPGMGTGPHCDVVYMGRGTRDRLYTAWVPIGDIPVEVGGLMILENSHKQRDRLRQYLDRDVDTYCTNGRHADDIEAGRKGWEWDGKLSSNPVSLREKLGGRWLTTAFRAGDLLTFPMHTVHASLDNPSDRVRLSSDSRYQPASEPADERWIGENPIGHAMAGKRGRIC
jgi:ectoine hydroxylase-related dioxygenase (phytanoyl-CoA dioxygenase family)